MKLRTGVAAATVLAAAVLVTAYFRMVVDPGRSIVESAGPAWETGRVVGERGLMVVFVGGARVKTPQLCAPTYSAEVRETASEVVIGLRSHELHQRRGNNGCGLIGYTNSLTVKLARPLGDRVVRDGHDQRVKDVVRFRLLRPGFIPAQLTEHSDQRGYKGSWTQLWSAKRSGGCSVSLEQGPEGTLSAREPTVAAAESVSITDTTARLTVEPNDFLGTLDLRWASGGQAFVMRTSSLCRGTLVTNADFVRMAQSLR